MNDNNETLPKFTINVEIRPDSNAILDESFGSDTLKTAFDVAISRLPDLLMQAGADMLEHELAAALTGREPSYQVTAEDTIVHSKTGTEVDVKVAFSL